MTPLPDAEYALTIWLRAHPLVADYAPVVDVRYPGRTPAVVVERIGGLADWLGAVDHPRLDVTCWHDSKAGAHDLASAVRAATHAISGAVVGDAVCGGVREVMGLRFVADEATTTPRYLFTVEITMRAPAAL